MKPDLSGLARIGQRLSRLEHADYNPLMVQWGTVIVEDNRRGVLAGLDKNDSPLAPVTYRPRPGAKRKRVPRKTGEFKGLGGSANGNLTSSQYRQLAGPPLAPQGGNSRVITNLLPEVGRTGGIWWAEAAWYDIVDTQGRSFLQYHLTGAGRLPKRDIAGVRAWGRQRAQDLLRTFVLKLLRRR